MITLKDIKISRNRLPLQNALWIRPLGGLSFKIYYPHGDSWAEIGIASSSSSDSDSKKSSSDSTDTTTKINGVVSNVIVAKAIPLKARPGNKYFFGCGQVLIKGTPYKKDTYSSVVYPIYHYSTLGKLEYTSYGNFGGSFPNWNPILVTIKTKEQYEKNVSIGVNVHIDKWVVEDTTLYLSVSLAYNLTCLTASPNFMIINGHLKNVARPRLPEFQKNIASGLSEAAKFDVKALKYRGNKIRKTAKWEFVGPALVKNTIPISLKRQWKPYNDYFGEYITSGSVVTKCGDDHIRKVFKVRQIRKRRKSVQSIIIRRAAIPRKSSFQFRYAKFKEIGYLK